MHQIRNKTIWFEIAGMAVLSVAFFQSGFLLLFFLIPLQILVTRRGITEYLYGSGISLLGIMLIQLIEVMRMEGATIDVILLSLDMIIPLLFMGGLLLLNLDNLRLRGDWVPDRKLRLMFASAAAGLISLSIILYIRGNEELQTLLEQQFAMIETAIQQTVFETGAVELTAVNGQNLMQFVARIFFSSYIASYGLICAGSWAFGTYLGIRSMGRREKLGLIDRFRLRNEYVWPLMISWGLVLLSQLIDLGPLYYIAFNAGLLMLFLYGVQGIAVLAAILDRYNISRGMRIGIIVMLIFFLFIPGLSWLVLIGVPGLGVSQIWIDYWKKKGEHTNDEGNTE